MQATRIFEAFRSPEIDLKKDPERARRFALHLTLRYRSVGETDWHEGRTENISRSGVLFWTEGPMEVNTRLEMSFVLPMGPASPSIVCRGHIVRTVPPSGWRARPAVAATISGYRFVRGKDAAA